MATPAPLIPTAALVPGASKATDQLTASAWEEGDWNSSELRGGISNEGDMTIRILFFDTSTLIKMFVKEDGSENIQWLTHPETKICNSLQFFVNDQVCLEFENKITYFEKTGRISKNKSDQILDAFASHCENRYFTVLGKKSLLFPKKQQTNIDDICDELNLKPGKNDWDGLIYQSIIDSLAFFSAESHPILVTCDKTFGEKVKNKGYRVINPIRQNREGIIAVFA